MACSLFSVYLDNIHKPDNKLVLVHAAEAPGFGASRKLSSYLVTSIHVHVSTFHNTEVRECFTYIWIFDAQNNIFN